MLFFVLCSSPDPAFSKSDWHWSCLKVAQGPPEGLTFLWSYESGQSNPFRSWAHGGSFAKMGIPKTPPLLKSLGKQLIPWQNLLLSQGWEGGEARAKSFIPLQSIMDTLPPLYPLFLECSQVLLNDWENKSRIRENVAIKRHSKQKIYGAAASITWHTVYNTLLEK